MTRSEQWINIKEISNRGGGEREREEVWKKGKWIERNTRGGFEKDDLEKKRGRSKRSRHDERVVEIEERVKLRERKRLSIYGSLRGIFYGIF